jgi:hypothetical protein
MNKLIKNLLCPEIYFPLIGAVLGGLLAFALVGGVWMTIAGFVGGGIIGIVTFAVLLIWAFSHGG